MIQVTPAASFADPRGMSFATAPKGSHKRKADLARVLAKHSTPKMAFTWFGGEALAVGATLSSQEVDGTSIAGDADSLSFGVIDFGATQTVGSLPALESLIVPHSRAGIRWL